jgi:hypothetical protein
MIKISVKNKIINILGRMKYYASITLVQSIINYSDNSTTVVQYEKLLDVDD